MRILLSILLFFTLNAEGQVIRANPFYRPIGGINEAQIFIDSAGITNQTQKDAIYALVQDLKDSSLWSSMIAIYPVVGGSADAHKWNLKNPAAYKLSYSGSITHSSNGMVSAGGYALTGINCLSVLSQNDLHLSYYSRTNSGGNLIEFGAENGSGVGVRIVLSYAGSNYTYLSNSYPGTPNFTPSTTAIYEIGSRTASGNYYVYGNGVEKVNKTSTSSTLPNFEMYLLSLNSNGSPFATSSRQCAFATVGTGLTATQARALNNIVEEFNDALSRGVQ